ncbi:Putative peptide/nitrate transporter [Glycine soja]|nr:Putative peptide/nitrate transporter [Glycine soja]
MWSGYMQQEEKAVLVDGKVDWKGRRALKHKHGGGLALLTVQAHMGSLTPPICNVYVKDAHCEKLVYVAAIRNRNLSLPEDPIELLPVKQPLPLSIFWLAFQYFIFGIADMLTYVGFLEFFYSEAPKGLKSTSTCFLWCSMALGYFLSSILVKIVNSVTKHITASGGWLTGNNINRNHLNLFYLFLSILSLINFFVYLFVSKRYKYRAQHPAVTGGNSEE